MKLTRRQKEVVRCVLELYRETQAPFHYSVLADRMGVNRYTAYDMLRLLEKKGLVASAYQVGDGRPGRSEILHLPTARASFVSNAPGRDAPDERWESLKQTILGQPENGSGPGHFLVDGQMAGGFANNDDEQFCLELFALLHICLRRVGSEARFRHHLAGLLPSSLVDCRPNLCLAGGLELGLLSASVPSPPPPWLDELALFGQRYQALITNLELPACQRLAAQMRLLLLSGASPAPG